MEVRTKKGQKNTMPTIAVNVGPGLRRNAVMPAVSFVQNVRQIPGEKMKTAIYIEDGVHQVVLTPENDFEKAALFSFSNRPIDAKSFQGTFYDCRGGWARQQSYYPQSKEPTSLILRLKSDSQDD